MIEIQIDGRRAYVVGQTFNLRNQLREAGCHWDTERRAWWISATKQEVVAQVLAATPPRSDEERQAELLERDRNNILGRAEYNGKAYYLVGQGESPTRGAWVRLLFRDGSKTFFKSSAEVQITHLYQRPQTLDALREYAARAARERQTGVCACRCHRQADCSCPRFCLLHHDGCERCGCEV